MRQKIKIGSFIGALIIGFSLFKMLETNAEGKKSNQKQNNKKSPIKPDLSKVHEINWKLLHKLDYKKNYAPKELKIMHGRMVKLPGFLVPLSYNHSELDEFLLVPDGRSCVHVPPPPPNLIVYVKLKSPIPVKDAYNPAWVTGVLEIETTKSKHGASSYKMTGMKVEKYTN